MTRAALLALTITLALTGNGARLPNNRNNAATQTEITK